MRRRIKEDKKEQRIALDAEGKVGRVKKKRSNGEVEEEQHKRKN